MIAPTQIRKPENWQDFEKLCKKLWGEIWECSASIRRNGRSGQKQKGVDISATPKGEDDYFGIQCKGKDENLNSTLTRKEIDIEIENAKAFVPPLKQLVFATSANKDVKIEEYVRLKDTENRKAGLFRIEIASWGDIVDFLEEYRETYNWYVNNCQYKDTTDVSISFDEQDGIEIKPQYIKTITEYYVKERINNFGYYPPNMISSLHKDLLNTPQISFQDILNPKKEVDYRWCTIPIKVRNSGSTVIEDYKLTLVFEADKIEKISDKFNYFNPGPLIDQSAIAIENNRRDDTREVFKSSEYYNVLEYKPITPLLVQEDYKRFHIGIKPKDNVEEIVIEWTLLSRDYTKNGKLYLKVVPEIEEKYERIEVDNIQESKVCIKPKIIME